MNPCPNHAGPVGAEEKARPDEDVAEPRTGRSETSGIRENLLRRRLDRELTQGQLAAKAGLSRAAVGRIERGEVIPKTLTLSATAVALETSLCDLAPSGAPAWQASDSASRRRRSAREVGGRPGECRRGAAGANRFRRLLGCR